MFYLFPCCWFLVQELLHHLHQCVRRGPAGKLSACKTAPHCCCGLSPSPRTLKHQPFKQCSVTHKLRPVRIKLSGLWCCLHWLLASWQSSRGRYWCMVQSYSTRETVQTSVLTGDTDCLKYQNWHSSMFRPTLPDSGWFDARPRLASPNKQQLTTQRCHVNLNFFFLVGKQFCLSFGNPECFMKIYKLV